MVRVIGSIGKTPSQRPFARSSYAYCVILCVALLLIYNLGSFLAPATSTALSRSSAELLGTPSYQLAFDQSYGFFDDITDEQWRRAQSIHARRFPNHNPSVDNPRHWHAQNFQEEFHCLHTERIPSTPEPDGQKWVCDPHRIAKQKDCLVYSVGSDGNVLFERGIKDQIGSHCEIHTFDIDSSNKRTGDYAEALKPYSSFHHWGIGTEEEASGSSNLKTLDQTIRELGHENRKIDIFKIDCEGCEWRTYPSWLAANNDIQQILVEIHGAPLPAAKSFFYDLHNAGYVIFSKEANYITGGKCVEFAFLKVSTDFFVNGTMY